MIDITRLELGWCAACNNISEVNQIEMVKLHSRRRVVLCDDCLGELRQRLDTQPSDKCQTIPAYMMEVH